MFGDNGLEGLPQLDQMRAGIDYRIQVKLRDFSVMMRPLTLLETTEVISSVVARLGAIPEDKRTQQMERTFHAKETLKFASTSDVGKNDYQLTEPMLDRMTPDEVQYLLKCYVRACDRVNPSLEDMPEEKLKELVEDLKKNISLVTELSFLEMANVCRHLIRGD